MNELLAYQEARMALLKVLNVKEPQYFDYDIEDGRDNFWSVGAYSLNYSRTAFDPSEDDFGYYDEEMYQCEIYHDQVYRGEELTCVVVSSDTGTGPYAIVFENGKEVE